MEVISSASPTGRYLWASCNGPPHVYCKIGYLRPARQQPAPRGKPVRMQVAGWPCQRLQSDQNIELLHVCPGVYKWGSQRLQCQLHWGQGAAAV